MAQLLPQLLIEELIKQGFLNPALVDEIQQEILATDGDFGEALVKRNIVTDGDLLTLKSQIYHIPVIAAAGLQIDKDLSQDIPENIITLYRFIPFSREAGVLKVALVNPENIDALEALKFLASDKQLVLEKYLVNYADYQSLRQSFKSLGGEVGKALQSFTEENSASDLKINEKTESIENITAEAPVTRIVAAIIKHAVDVRASDIHMEPFEDRIRLRFRIDGDLQTTLSLPRTLLSALVTRIKILADMKIDETRLAQDGRFSTKINDRNVDFRVSTLPIRNGEKVVMRILDPMVGNISLTDLGLQGRSLEIILAGLARPFGSILITGPTGSGKSTTLAAMLRHVNDEGINIITLEDPIEYYVNGVNQSQIHEEIGYTFASGLRHILRQDPDIIMVGEIRDRETASLATQAALTGHVVLSTLHTNDTIGVIPRLIDMGVERYLLAPTLNAALAQRLVRKLCQTCKKKQLANPAEAEIIRRAIATMAPETQKDLPRDNFEVYKAGDGCPECGGKAYKGRMGIFEVLNMTDEVEAIILSSISEEALREAAVRQGMVTMFQDGIIKVLQGSTSLEEVLQAAQDYDEKEDVEVSPAEVAAITKEEEQKPTPSL